MSKIGWKQTLIQTSFTLASFQMTQVTQAEEENEGPEPVDLLAGDGPMGGLWGVLGSSDWRVGIFTYLLPHLQKSHPAASYHEHRSVRMTALAKANLGDIRQMCCCLFFVTSNRSHCSLFLQAGVTIFDCEEKTLESIAEKIVSEMVNKKELRPKDKDGVLKSLLQNPRYPQPNNHQTLLKRTCASWCSHGAV